MSEYIKSKLSNGALILDFADEILTDGKEVDIYISDENIGKNISDTATMVLSLLVEFGGYFSYCELTKRYKITINDTKGIKFFASKEI